MEIAKMLKLLRVENELTQKQLGDLCFMKDSQIRRYENGYSIPSAKTLENILVAFDLAYCIESKQKESVKFVFNFSFADLEHKPHKFYYFILYKNSSYIIDPIKDKPIFHKLKRRIYTTGAPNSVLFHANSCNNVNNKSITINDGLEKNILDKANVLNDQGKQKAIDYMDDLAQMDKYKK